MRVERVAGSLGAEVSEIDLSQPLTDAAYAALRQAWLEHLVLFFRDQALTPAQYLAFAKRFGEPVEYPFVKGLDDHPEIIQVLKLPHEQVNFGGVWHSDTTYLDVPPMASMLLAREVPPAGGDTLFANMYLAYETLSPGMRRMLDGLRGVASSSKADASKTREDRLKDSARTDAKTEYVASHPAVRVHPETGRRALFVNVAHTTHFEGMTPEESAPILRYLCEHLTKPEFTCRFRWRPGAIAFWDNRSTQHNAINDYHGYKRSMLRITLAGDKPAGP